MIDDSAQVNTLGQLQVLPDDVLVVCVTMVVRADRNSVHYGITAIDPQDASLIAMECTPHCLPADASREHLRYLDRAHELVGKALWPF